MIRKVSGVPEGLKSDNGPPFNSPKFDEYAQEEGFRSCKVTPGWPKANGERIKMTMRIVALQGKPVWEEVHRGIRAYRATHGRESEQDDVGSRAPTEIPGGQSEGTGRSA